jgi:hypothetical protein
MSVQNPTILATLRTLQGTENRKTSSLYVTSRRTILTIAILITMRQL